MDETDRTLTPQEQAAQTKRRRSRARLIAAADEVLRDDGFEAKVDTICEEAGISTATFYTLFSSRNALAVEAYTELVVVPFEQSRASGKGLRGGFDALVGLSKGRHHLLRAALVGRLEAGDDRHLPVTTIHYGELLGCWLELHVGHDFVDRLVVDLAKWGYLKQKSSDNPMDGLGTDWDNAVRVSALYAATERVLTALARRESLALHEVVTVLERA